MTAMFDLDRFVTAQASCYGQVLAELAAGQKRTHWMWFIFPQIAGLGVRPTAQFYAIDGLAEAAAYLAHPLLGARLLECSRVVVTSPAPSAGALLGSIDALKLCSSMTLFAATQPGEPVFAQVLDKYYDGRRDPRTLALLAA